MEDKIKTLKDHILDKANKAFEEDKIKSVESLYMLAKVAYMFSETDTHVSDAPKAPEVVNLTDEL